MEPDLPGQLEAQDLEDSQINNHKITAHTQNAKQESYIQGVRLVTQ